MELTKIYKQGSTKVNLSFERVPSPRSASLEQFVCWLARDPLSSSHDTQIKDHHHSKILNFQIYLLPPPDTIFSSQSFFKLYPYKSLMMNLYYLIMIIFTSYKVIINTLKFENVVFSSHQ